MTRGPFHTSTETIIRKMFEEKNPVTCAVYRQILGNRIDSAHELLNRRRNISVKEPAVKS